MVVLHCDNNDQYMTTSYFAGVSPSEALIAASGQASALEVAINRECDMAKMLAAVWVERLA